MTEQKLKKQTERDIRTRVLFSLLPWIGLVLLVCIGLVKDCAGPKVDPMDDSINAAREIVRHLDVYDSTRNGFRAVYATTRPVTTARLEEIRSRKEVNETFRYIQENAAPYFGGSLLETDIYDFAAYIRRFEIEDVRLHNIFVAGEEKQDMYVRPNPNLENAATWINGMTEQGVQYINADDIYTRTKKSERIYRYWRCSGNRSMSRTDERFSHFSEDERLW